MTPPKHSELTAPFIASALGLPSDGTSQTPLTAITTDSRKVPQGSLFVAIPGDKFDGHQFIPAAVTSGAAAILCRKDYDAPAEASGAKAVFFRVDDTVEGYRRIAGAWRQGFDIPVIAVAGSVGKTTTKELLAAVLKGRWKNVLRTIGSQNGFVGIPMTLMDLSAETEAAVVEVGIDEKGAMVQHMDLVRPDYALLTAIGPEHLEKLENMETVFREEALALEMTMQAGGTVFINLDDPYIRRITPQGPGNAIGYTLTAETPKAAFPVVQARISPDGGAHGSLLVQIPAGVTENSGETAREAAFPLVLPGEHNAGNQLAAITVAIALGLSDEQIRQGLAGFKPAAGRTELHDLPGRPGLDVRFICDHYNSNPTSVRAALKLLNEQASSRQGERWACLGDMLELGTDEERYHRELASELIECGIEHVLLYGPRMSWLHEELESRGFEGQVSHLDSHGNIAEILWRKLRNGDTVLLKGSRGMRMEEVWKNLTSRAK